jgi:predicted amidohydrolase YtcJ
MRDANIFIGEELMSDTRYAVESSYGPRVTRSAPRATRHAPRALMISLVAVGVLGCSKAPAAGDAADLALLGGHVVTVDSARPEAQAIAIRGDRVLAVGTDEEIRRYVGSGTEVIELNGRLVIPGFIEGHGHFTGLGESKLILDLATARSWSDIVGMVAREAELARPGAWIAGRGWHQEKWEQAPQPNVEGVPLHHDLSRVSPNNPVILGHASGHAAFVNAKAMELAGIDRSTRNPAGGEIVKDSTGAPTGLLRETAQRLVGRARDSAEAAAGGQSWADFKRVVELAGQEALSHGVTTFHDAGSSFETIDKLKILADSGLLPLRLYVMVRREPNDEMSRRLPDYRLIGYGDNFLTVRAIKRQIDGALGPHGAWLLERYEDLPSSTGLTLEPPEDIARTAEIAIANGFQVNTHAIGDRANRVVLDIYERVFTANPDKTDLRWRIEHAQHLHPSDVGRFARLGVIASMQGVHATSDGPWVIKRLGQERAKSGAYLWRSLLDSGVVVTNGTDVPVERIDPIASFYATVSRRMSDGNVFFPEQRMTREEALRSYTMANAYAAFEEDIKGSITPGKLADIVVLSKDIMRVPEEEIPTARVDLTIVGGSVRYGAKTVASTRR